MTSRPFSKLSGDPGARLAAATLGVAAGVLAWYRTGQWDYWFHLAAGRSIATHGLPTQENWCASAWGQWPWLGEWLFHLTIFHLHAAFGDMGVALWRATLAAVAMALAVGIAMRLRASPLAVLLAGPLALAILRARQDPRPEQVSVVLALLFVTLLERCRRGAPFPFVGLGLLQALWANLHVGWIMGPLIVLTYAAMESLAPFENAARRRALQAWLAVIVTWVAALATPRPLDTVTLRALVDAWQDPGRAGIDELRPWGWAADRTHPYTVLLTVGITALAIGGRRVWRQSPPALMLAVVALAAGVATFRQQSFAALAALPALACALTFETRGWRRWTGLALATGAGLAGVVALIGTWRSYAFGASPLELAVPMRAVAFADSLGLEGQVLNTSWYGGYILWARGDRHPPLVDTRNRGSLEFRSQFRRAQTDPTAFDSMLSEWRFTHAIVQPLGENPDQLALWLARRSDWALIFTDDAGLLYVRRDAYPALATRFGYAMLTPDYTALGTLGARAARDTSLGRILGSELARARASSPWHARASLWLGLLRLAEGKPSEAAALLDEVEVLAPTMPGLALRQAMAHEAIGDLAQAESAYRRALREDADAPAARAALERLTRR